MPDESSLLHRHAASFDTNRARWDESVAIHAASEGYNLAGFLRGEKSLTPVELEELGDVRGKTLLHLQCHFGMDTLNWARLGATVTGLDFSLPAIERARQLATEIGMEDARFVHANVYDAASILDETFDIVYTAIGALCWLPDVRAWAKVVSRLLRPGGTFYIYEGHPVLWSIDDERDDELLVMAYPYFETADGNEFVTETTYVDGLPLVNQKTVQWNHGLGEIVTELIDAGLAIEFVHEHRELPWKALPWMVESGSPTRGAWRLPPGREDNLPLMYSIRATKG